MEATIRSPFYMAKIYTGAFSGQQKRLPIYSVGTMLELGHFVSLVQDDIGLGNESVTSKINPIDLMH